MQNLQYENVTISNTAYLPGEPRDGGAWWAPVYGVA